MAVLAEANQLSHRQKAVINSSRYKIQQKPKTGTKGAWLARML